MPPAPSISHWLPLSPLGSGSFAHVSLALNLADGSLFAVKSAPSHILLNELTLLHSLHSPFIIQCLGADLCPGDGTLPRLFLEYMDAGSLADILRRSPTGKLCDEKLVRRYTGAIVQGLDYLHQNGVVHCDIKSHNILIGQSGVKIGDFGAAQRRSDGACGASGMDGMARGTPLWMAPEVLRGEEQEAPSDMWSLGCTVVEMLQGRPPWGHVTSLEALLCKVGNPNESPPLPEHVSAEAKDFLRKCLHREPKERAAAAELLQHPFLCGMMEDELGAAEAQGFKSNQPSPRSTLDVLYSSENESDCESMPSSTSSLLFPAHPLCGAGSLFPAGGRSPSSPAERRSSEGSDWIIVRRAKKCRNMEHAPFTLASAAHEVPVIRRGSEVSFDCAGFLQKRRSNVG